MTDTEAAVSRPRAQVLRTWRTLRDLVPETVWGPFLATRVAIYGVAALSAMIVLKQRWYTFMTTTPEAFLHLLRRWDAPLFLQISVEGYTVTPGHFTNVAFFPLYPCTLRALNLFTGNPDLSAFLLSNLALLVAGALLHRVVLELGYGRGVAAQTVLLLFVFPASFFFSSAYSESLFLALSLGSFLMALRKRWWLAGLLGGLLAMTRHVGVLIFFPLLLEYMEVSFECRPRALRAIKIDILNLLLVPAGTLLFMLYLFLSNGDALAFVHATAANHRGVSSLQQTVASLAGYGPFYRWVFGGLTLLAVGAWLLMLRLRLRPSLFFYAFALLLVYLTSGLMEAFPRYLSVVFPLYLAVALLLQGRHPFWSRLIEMASFALLVLCTILFTNGYWCT